MQLVVEPVQTVESATLNQRRLVIDAQGRADITDRIAEHNQLALNCLMTSQSDAESCPFDVRLEITEQHTDSNREA